MKDIKHQTSATEFKTQAREIKNLSTLSSIGVGTKVPTIQMGFHVEKDLSDVLKTLSQEYGKGTNSKIINHLLREFFINEKRLPSQDNKND